MIEKIRQDLNDALRAGDKLVVSVLRGLIASIQNAEIAKKGQLNDQEIVALLQKESKKRTEAADLYEKASSSERATIELQEKQIIDNYLPEQLSDEELQRIIDEAISELSPAGFADMGKVIGAVKQNVGAEADGARIASLVKDSLGKV